MNWAGDALPNGTQTAIVNNSATNIPTITADSAFVVAGELCVAVWAGPIVSRLDHVSGSLSTGSAWTLIGAGANGSTGIYSLADTTVTGGAHTGFGVGSGSLSTNAIHVSDPFGGNSSGVFNINTSGTVSTNFEFVVGHGTTTGNTAALNIDGGTISAGGLFVVADQASSHGTVNMSNGSLSASGEFWVGQHGTGVFNQSGGTVSSGNWFCIGRDTSGVGTYNLTGGAVNAAATNQAVLSSFAGGTSFLNVSGGQFNAANNLYVGEGGNGTLNVSGTGLVTTGESSAVRLGVNPSGVGTVNLNGGSLQTSSVSEGDGAGTFNFNGGTLKATFLNHAFMTGLTSVNIRNGGAVIDTNDNDVTIGQDLKHSAISGDASTDGGLTKRGGGTLILTGTNTYNGDTNVLAGTLELALPTLHNKSAVSLSTDATLYLNHFETDAVEALLVNGAPLDPGLYRAAGEDGEGIALPQISGTGKLLVTGVVADAYDDWVDGYFSGVSDPLVVGKDADPDHDGQSNAIEFALDGNPNSGAATGKYVGKVSNVGGVAAFVLTLPVRTGVTFSGTTEQVSDDSGGVVYRIQGSDNLADWNLAVSEVLDADKATAEANMPNLTPGGDWTYRTFRSPGAVVGDPSEFLRAAIEAP